MVHVIANSCRTFSVSFFSLMCWCKSQGLAFFQYKFKAVLLFWSFLLVTIRLLTIYLWLLLALKLIIKLIRGSGMADIELEIPAPNGLEKCWKINELVNIFDNTKEIFSLDLKCSILQFFVRFVQLLLIELKIFVKYGWIYIWRSSNLEKKQIFKEIVCLDVSKACQDTDTDVPTKIIRENADIFTNFARPSTDSCF